jgi:hypothetical protein
VRLGALPPPTRSLRGPVATPVARFFYTPGSPGAHPPLDVLAIMSTATPPMTPCRYHSAAPDPRCLGCRLAMGAEPDSYFVSDGFQGRYSSLANQIAIQERNPPQPPQDVVPEPPLSPAGSLGESDEESYLLRMRFAMQEMDSKVEFVAAERFLDLG